MRGEHMTISFTNNHDGTVTVSCGKETVTFAVTETRKPPDPDTPPPGSPPPSGLGDLVIFATPNNGSVTSYIGPDREKTWVL